MRSLRVRELLMLVGLVGLALGWAADRARTARREAVGSMRTYVLAERVTAAEARAEALARRLRECEAAAVPGPRTRPPRRRRGARAGRAPE